MATAEAVELVKRASGQYDLDVIRVLDLSGSPWHSALVLPPLPSLVKLCIRGVPVSQLDCSASPLLVELDAGRTRLTTLSWLSTAPKLEVLRLDGCGIRARAELRHLSALPRLRSLDLLPGNPAAEPIAEVIPEIVAAVPSLQVLDGMGVEIWKAGRELRSEFAAAATDSGRSGNSSSSGTLAAALPPATNASAAAVKEGEVTAKLSIIAIGSSLEGCAASLATADKLLAEL